MNTILPLLRLPFVQRALVAGLLISVVMAILGLNLVLKRYSMIGDGLSHVGFGTTAVALATGFAPLAVSVPLVLLSAFILLRISENSKIRGDAMIALISSSALAVGVIAISVNGVTADIYNYLFGSILTMSKSDMYFSIAVCAVVAIAYILCYHKLFAITFDADFAKASGIKTEFFNLLLSLLTALVVVVGMRTMGAMLISSLTIFPALSAMRVTKSYKGTALAAAAISATCFLVGMLTSFILDTPASATIVLTNLASLIIFSSIATIKK